MLELSADNTLDYLRQRGWIDPGPARVDLLAGGVSNVVLRVETAGRPSGGRRRGIAANTPNLSAAP